MADVTLPEGWMALPGGGVYNPQTNKILTQSQAAYTFGVPNPERFLTPQTPAAPPTPTYGMDENGNIGPAPIGGQDTGGMMYAAQSLAAGYNPNSGLPEPSTVFNGRQYTLSQLLDAVKNPAQAMPYSAPAQPELGSPEWINWVMGALQPTQAPQAPNPTIAAPASPVPGLQDIRNQVGGTTPSFPTASTSNSGTSMLGWMNGTSMETTQPNPQYAPVQDTSAWRAAPSALTPLQQGGRGMLYS